MATTKRPSKPVKPSKAPSTPRRTKEPSKAPSRLAPMPNLQARRDAQAVTDDGNPTSWFIDEMWIG